MSLKKIIILVCSIVMLFVLSPLPLNYAQADEYFEEMSTEDSLYVRGVISRVSLDDKQIFVRPPQGKRIAIGVVADTILEGFEELDDLAKKQQVKVWYSPVDDKNTAIKIVKIVNLGC